MRRKRAGLKTLFLLALFISGPGLWLRAERRQYALNRQLITALVRGDNKQVFAIVNEGADPNTRYEPTPKPTLLELVKQLFHLSAPPDNDSPTAWLIACGAYWDDGSGYMKETPIPDDPQLVRAMLRHGANIEAQDHYGWTALLTAVSTGRRNSVVILLQHHANINITAYHGGTPLIAAMKPEPDRGIVRLLLEHGADPNAVDKYGNPVLYLAVDDNVDIDMIRQLIAHGAKSNLFDTIQLAQQNNRPDIVALLKHYEDVQSQGH